MIRSSLSVTATIAYALAFLLYFFGISNGIGEAETTTSIFYMALIGAGALIALIWMGKTGEELLYPFILTGAVSVGACFTVILETSFSALLSIGSLAYAAIANINEIEKLVAFGIHDLKAAALPFLFLAPILSIYALDRVSKN
mgnify:CR=1 FL=1